MAGLPCFRALVLLSAALLLSARRCSSTPLTTRRRSTRSKTPPLAERGGRGACSGADFGTSGGARACRLFLWDAASACRYHLCVRMLRANLYEGLGGKKFVRIRPGSLLQSLYPCSDHAPNRCAICGLSFPEHLGEWWRPRGGSPYDTHLDIVSEGGVIPPEEEGPAKGCGWRGGKRRSGGRNGAAVNNGGVSELPSSAKILCFHRRYVQEIAPPLAGNQPTGDSNSSGHIDDEAYERRRESSIYYRIPRFRGPGSHQGLVTNLLGFARAIVIDELETLLWLQERENSKLQKDEDQKIRL